VPTRQKIWTALKETTSAWSDHNASRLAAALSYYALLSIAPLLLVTVALMGLVFGQDDARARVVGALSSVVGPQGTAAVETLANSARSYEHGTLGSIIAVVVALFGASSAFVELQAALNTIWNVPRRGAVVRAYAIDRFWSFVMVLGVASLLLCSVLSSAVLSVVGEFFSNALPGGHAIWALTNYGISLGLTTLLFAVVFRCVPDAQIAWSDVWLGSFITALLFVLGNLLLGFYLGKSGVTSSFGGAGSVVALVIWVYYSAQIVFVGAEFTEVYSRSFGSRRDAPPPRAARASKTASEPARSRTA
jgi:membrane protein